MVELTIRCCNRLGLDDEDAVDEVWELLTEAPYLKPEPGDDDPAVGGYKPNNIADRRTYDLQQLPYSIGPVPASGSWAGSQGDYERRSRLLRSARLFIVAVSYNSGEFARRSEELDEDDEQIGFWGDGTELAAPIEVRRTGSAVGDERTAFRWTVSLEDCKPTVGV